MAKLRVLVQRRKAVRNIRKITRTMELIAGTRFRRALDRAIAARDYAYSINEIAADLAKNVTEVSHPLLIQRNPVKNSLLLIICSNRGLCGGYNASILREATQHLKEFQNDQQTMRLDLSGRRAINFFKSQKVSVRQTYTQFEDKPTYAQVEQLAEDFIRMYAIGEVDRIEVAYMRFYSLSRQRPVIETLLPFTAEEVSKGGGTTAVSSNATTATSISKSPSADYDFLPSASEILAEIVPAACKFKLFKCYLDAAVSEQIARRIAMKAATENAADLIKDLSRQYNRARQANITREISELIGGAEALK